MPDPESIQYRLSTLETALLKKPANECNLITMHIGNGVSHCAIKNGISVDTSMGLTPLEGAVMGTRCGDIDPAIPGFMMQIEGVSAQEIDGILNKIEPGEPLDKNIYELPPEELKKVPNVAGSLGEALDSLEKDHEFLLKGDVFTSDFLDMWIATKRKEHDALRLRPHPYEFFLYYDV